MDRGEDRLFAKSHPWITFRFVMEKLSPGNWMRIGEALSKCDHLSGVPLAPRVAQELHSIYLAKGVHATTSIEGNTLSEKEVLARLSGDLELPETQDYLGQEVDNIIEACEMIIRDIAEGNDLTLTPQRISLFNGIVLKDLPLEEDVVAGQTRTIGVNVGNVYRGVPAEDCEYLVARLCEWIQQLEQAVVKTPYERPLRLLLPILAHLYIAWIHPFGDGNGRTARLVEFQLLASAGLPTPACHLLSNYYNRTRTKYYAVLKETSRAEPYPVERFISYALDGLVEELREQLDVVRQHQFNVAWVNYVHSNFSRRQGVTASKERQRDLVLSLPVTEYVAISDIPELNTRMAVHYANKQQKTVSRDINALEKLGLIERTKAGIRAKGEIMAAFLPLRQANEEQPSA